MTQLLRANGISPVILPIIIMSSHGSKILVEAAYESGGNNDWLSKPINMHEAGARVREQVLPRVKPATCTPSHVLILPTPLFAACLTCATVDYY